MDIKDPLYEGLALQTVSVSKKTSFQPRYMPIPPWIIPRQIPTDTKPVKLQLKH